jgi:hypothetical protein
MDKMSPGALAPQLNKPLDRSVMGSEVGALSGLLNTLNKASLEGVLTEDGRSPAEAMVEAEGIPQSAEPPSIAQPAPVYSPAPQSLAPQTQFSMSATRNLSRVFYTGRLCVGKDHVAKASNARIVGFADPIYRVVALFSGLSIDANRGKDIPGVRECLQTVGQWGRGEFTPKYPLTPARMLFCRTIRTLGKEIGDDSVDWESYGLDRDIWLKALAKRIADIPEDQRLAITNARFENEFKFFKGQGFEHYHVMCSPQTWVTRLAKRGLTDKSPAVTDMSEQLAAVIDRDAIKQVSANKNGGKLHVIWNDDQVPPPSRRLLTVPEYLQQSNNPVDEAAALAGLASLE